MMALKREGERGPPSGLQEQGDDTAVRRGGELLGSRGSEGSGTPVVAPVWLQTDTTQEVKVKKEQDGDNRRGRKDRRREGKGTGASGPLEGLVIVAPGALRAFYRPEPPAPRGDVLHPGTVGRDWLNQV